VRSNTGQMTRRTVKAADRQTDGGSVLQKLVNFIGMTVQYVRQQ